jgi:hypothetical protein
MLSFNTPRVAHSFIYGGRHYSASTYLGLMLGWLQPGCLNMLAIVRPGRVQRLGSSVLD